MIPVPGGKAFLMPVALVMQLYRHHTGTQSLRVLHAPADLDVVASRAENRVFLHVVNTHRTRPISASLQLAGLQIQHGTIHQLAADSTIEVLGRDAIALTQHLLEGTRWQFPAASVSAVELEVAEV